MKILLSEEWHSHIYAEPFLQRFSELGVEAHAFKEVSYFGGNEDGYSRSRVGSLLGRVQRRLNAGPAYARLNADLLARAARLRPEAVFLFRGNNIEPETLRRLKALGIHIVGWNNDDPFSPRASVRFWRRFVEGIPLYDRLWAYRTSNAAEFEARGCSRSGVLRSFYIRELNFPVAVTAEHPFRAEVSFIGHWEPDGRDAFVAALLGEEGLNFKLWGTLWDRSPLSDTLEQRFGAVKPLFKLDYNLAINAANIALVFLSKLNRDTYTRRCFEIPATGTMMLSEYTDDLATLFEEGKEAEFFRSPGEMIEKIRFYTNNVEARLRIGRAGRERLLRDGHEALDRAKVVLGALTADLAKKVSQATA